MRSILLTATLFLGAANLFSQSSNAVLFAENGERFTIILNGARQNDSPETQVRITDLNAEYYKMRIIFEDPANGILDKPLYLVMGTERSYNIKKNNKGEFVLRMVSETPLAQLPPPRPEQRVVVYNPNPQPAAVTVTETTTTVVHGNPDQVSMGVSAPGVNMNIQINDGIGTQTTTTTYSTTTSSSSTVGQPVQQDVYVMPGYSGPVGCPWPLSAEEFQGVRNTISSQTWDETKLTIAKQVISSNCLLSGQVRDIMMLFGWEETKLDLAKYAYGYTFDIGNYYKLNDAFEWESSVTELNRYINSR